MENAEYLNHPLIKPNKIESRLYQQTLFASCANKNSLVVLPTGLGKTILFIMVAAHRLQKFPEGKIIFCAPTKPLLDQHLRTTKDLMEIEDKQIIQLSGAIDPLKRENIWKLGRVFICTPQTLQNDIIQKRVNLDDVVLLCLDEAHKSVGDHSYVFIAEQYNKKAKNPLLLGITASPGSESERIQELQDNLGITNIEIRDETSDDVRQYIHEIEETWEKVALPEEFGIILTTLGDLFRKILEELKEMEIIKSANPQNNPRRELLKLRQKVNEKYSQTMEEDRGDFFKAMGLVGNSIRLSHAIELIETQGVPSLSKYLERQINEIRMGKGSRALKNLMLSEEMITVVESVKQLQEQKIIHPKLQRLKEIIAESVENNPLNRILVFAHFRSAVKTIDEELNKIQGVSSHWFVGQSSMRDDKGLSQKNQIEIMQSFRDGLYNILVSTSVAEEGLDIGECDLVIFYDSVPSAIRLIQRKGRTGRRRKGKVIMLIAEGTRDEGYMWAAKRRTQKMRRLVKEYDILEKNRSVSAKNKQKGLLEYLKKEKKEEIEVALENEKINEKKEEIKEKTKPEISDEGKIAVICDIRERNTTIIKELMKKEVNLGFERLDVGDYICSDQVIIERKEVNDLVKSIIDKRLFTQAKILTESCSKPLIIIEGDLDLHKTSLHPNALTGALSSLVTDFRIPLIYTKNQKETAEMILAISKREQLERKRRVSVGKRKGLGMKIQIEETIASLPHVDHKIATRLLKHFGSIRNVFTAKLEDYLAIRGIGEKIAIDIIDYLYANYNEVETGEIEEALDELEWMKKEKEKKTKN